MPFPHLGIGSFESDPLECTVRWPDPLPSAPVIEANAAPRLRRDWE